MSAQQCPSSSNNADSTGNGCESAESEDQEDSTSSQDIEDVLASFRDKWQKELRISTPKPECGEKGLTMEEEEDFEVKAKKLFIEGIELEKSGKLYEAIQFYRRAVQLVPDIEFRIDYIYKNKNRELQSDDVLDGTKTDEDIHISSDDDSDEIDEDNFFNHIQKKINQSPFFCLPARQQQHPHISCLPMEILLYIFKWVVSSDLDIRSLEICSYACRGFYLCARDSEIWKLACSKIWGLNCGTLGYYKSWRQMFIERPRLHFHGCYISKTTYMRHGQNSFQDQFYRPWHFVAYYRYLRFFPEGLVLMLTTADEPLLSVGHLKYRNVKGSAVLRGHYRLKDDKVTVVVHKQENPKKQANKRTRRNETIYDMIKEQVHHLEFQIQNHKNKRHVLLIWKGYSISMKFTNGQETTNKFELVGNRYPPLWFSRVKSYTLESLSPLQ